MLDCKTARLDYKTGKWASMKVTWGCNLQSLDCTTVTWVNKMVTLDCTTVKLENVKGTSESRKATSDYTMAMLESRKERWDCRMERWDCRMEKLENKKETSVNRKEMPGRIGEQDYSVNRRHVRDCIEEKKVSCQCSVEIVECGKRATSENKKVIDPNIHFEEKQYKETYYHRHPGTCLPVTCR